MIRIVVRILGLAWGFLAWIRGRVGMSRIEVRILGWMSRGRDQRCLRKRLRRRS